jgi:hypothetical protein
MGLDTCDCGADYVSEPDFLKGGCALIFFREVVQDSLCHLSLNIPVIPEGAGVSLSPHLGATYLGIPRRRLNGWSTFHCHVSQIIGDFF